MSVEQVPPSVKKPALSGLLSRKNLFRLGLLGAAGIALLLFPASSTVMAALLGLAVGAFGAAFMASFAWSGIKSFFSSDTTTPVTGSSTKKPAVSDTRQKVTKAVEKADIPRGKDIKDPMTNLLVKQLESCGLQVSTDWSYGKKVLAGLPEKYDHLKKNHKTINGFVYQGVVYINPAVKGEATPVHEYTHIWAEMLRQKNPDEWKHIVGMLKENRELWQKVEDAYPHLQGDDEIADEVLATFSGDYAQQFIRDHYDADRSPADVLDSVRGALAQFWKAVCSVMNTRFTSVEQVSSMVLRDFLNGVNPLKEVDDQQRMSDRVPLGSIADHSAEKEAAVGNDDRKVNVLTGDAARKAVHDILSSEQDGYYPFMIGTVGYFADKSGDGKTVFSAFDNISGDCWCEDFKTRDGAKKWCLGEMSTEEVREMESNIEEIILSKDSFSEFMKGRVGNTPNQMPPYVKFDENGEMAVSMQFFDGYAFDTNPHGLGTRDRVALYYPTIDEVLLDEDKQKAIKAHTGRDWLSAVKREKIYDIALTFGKAGRLKCPQERFDAAVKAIVERASDKFARSFTPAQRDTVQLAAACNGEMFYTPGSFREVFYDMLFSQAQNQLKDVRIAWVKDTHQELKELARDEVREQGLGLHR